MSNAPTWPRKYGPPITLNVAKIIMQAAEAEANQHDLPMVIAIMDSGAQLLMLHRMDDAQFGSVQVAIRKAETAVSFRRPTSTFEGAVANGGRGLRLLSVDNMISLEGGIPLVQDGAIVGAIGVSGMASEEDVQVANAGVEAFIRHIQQHNQHN